MPEEWKTVVRKDPAHQLMLAGIEAVMATFQVQQQATYALLRMNPFFRM